MKDQVNFSLLTPREQMVMALWICGQTAKQSAAYLDRSNRTVEYYRERIKCKLGIYCASELQRVAFKSGQFFDLMKYGMHLIYGDEQQEHKQSL